MEENDKGNNHGGRKWLIAAAVATGIELLLVLWLIFFEWGAGYFFAHIGRALKPIALTWPFFLVMIRLLIFALDRNRYLRQGAKAGTRVDVQVFEGVPNMPRGTLVTLSQENTELVILHQATKKTVRLPYQRIKKAEMLTEEIIREKGKSVAGRAVVGSLLVGSLGGLFLGGVGAVVGGMTGLGTKSTAVSNRYLVINYESAQSKELNALSFLINANVTWNLQGFLTNLRARAGITQPSLLELSQENDITL